MNLIFKAQKTRTINAGFSKFVRYLLLERINKRASENENIRNDDNSLILKNRIKVYKKAIFFQAQKHFLFLV